MGKVATVFLGLMGLFACGRTGLGEPPVVVKATVPCPELVRQPFHQIAENTGSATRVTCDGLVWRQTGSLLKLSLAGQAPRTLTTHAEDVRVSPSGRLIAWFDGLEDHLYSIIADSEHVGLSQGSDTQAHPESAFFLVGPDGVERLVGWDQAHALTALDETGRTTTLAVPSGATAERWVPDHGDAVIISTQTSLFAVSGSGRPTVDLGIAIDPQNDLLTLSPDGQILIYEPRRMLACGDTFCPEAAGATRILSTVTGAELTTSPQLRRTSGLLDARADVRFATDDGHAFATADTTGGVLAVDTLFRVHRYPLGQLVAPPNGNHVLTGDTHFVEEPMVVHSLADESKHDLFPTSEAVLVSHDGTAAMGSNISDTCIKQSDGYTCRQQLWTLYGGPTARGGAAWTMTALQPVQPLWLSSGLDALAFGSMLSEPAPTTAADDLVALWQVWLISADGTRTALGAEAPVTVGTAFRRPVIATQHTADLVSLTSHTRTTLATAGGTMRLLLNESSSFVAAAGQEVDGETLWGGTVTDP